MRHGSNLILVARKAGLSEKELDKAISVHRGRRREHWRKLNLRFVRLPAGVDALQVAGAMAGNNGARGAVVSFGGVCGSAIPRSAAKYMRDRGGVVVASSGNTGSQQYLGASHTMTCVGATDSSDARTSWSTFGDHVDVVAPADGIYTTTNGGG